MNSEIIKNIIDSPLSFDDYTVLRAIRDNETYLYPKFNQKFKDTIERLQFEGYLDYSTSLNRDSFKAKHEIHTTFILQKGRNILNQIEAKEVKEKEVVVNRCEDLYQRIQNKLISLTGKKNPKANGEYYFLPSKQDFCSELEKCIKKYNLKDFDKVSKCLLNYTQLAYNQKFNYIQLLKYFISKNNKSTLAEQYENFEEENIKKEDFDGAINI